MICISNKTSLYIAIENGNVEIVKLLLEKKEIDCNIKLIFDYIKIRNQYIVEEKNEINVLHFAIEKENVQIVQMLLSNPEIDVNSYSLSFYEREYRTGHRNRYYYYSKYALHRAIEKSNTKIVQMLLNHSNIHVNCYIDLLQTEKDFAQEFGIHILMFLIKMNFIWQLNQEISI